MAHTQQNSGQKGQADKQQAAKHAAKSQTGSANQNSQAKQPAKKDDQQNRSGKH